MLPAKLRLSGSRQERPNDRQCVFPGFPSYRATPLTNLQQSTVPSQSISRSSCANNQRPDNDADIHRRFRPDSHEAQKSALRTLRPVDIYRTSIICSGLSTRPCLLQCMTERAPTMKSFHVVYGYPRVNATAATPTFL